MNILGKYIFLLVLSILLIEGSAVAVSLDAGVKLLLFDDESCDKSIDTDKDRLSDCFETNTGVFVSKKNTGTDPRNPDTDGDGIKDGDETLGTASGLKLQLMGTNPLRKNILIEYDWFNDSKDCGFHSHRPTPGAIKRVARAFEKAPVKNPDGSRGIYLIQDYGQSPLFKGGNKVYDSDGRLNGDIEGHEFANHKAANFSPNRLGYFHYILLVHRYNRTSDSSGQAELPGDDSIVSLNCFYISPDIVASTIMHELGHNLKLRHGGHEHCNYKPNYNSVMNYRFQFAGIDKNTSCDAKGDGVLAYSTGKRINLNEFRLNENKGVCGSKAIDWNSNGLISNPVKFDVNSDAYAQGTRCGGHLSTLKDHDDWNNLIYLKYSSVPRSPSVDTEIITESNLPKFPILP